MLDLSDRNITLCCVSDSPLLNTSAAIAHTLNKCKFTKVKLFTSKNLIDFTYIRERKDIEVVKIDPINTLHKYSTFMLCEINDYIDTDYILTIQYDGIVVRPEAWKDEFLQYDYIGAPWSDGVVGNSGFCIRSKKLLSTIQKHSDVFDGIHFPDDVKTCRGDLRKYWENLGLTYAPYDLATDFSFEIVGKKSKSFGIHNRSIAYKTLSKKYSLQRIYNSVNRKK